MTLIGSAGFCPLPEQEFARELFSTNEGLRIDAYAGTGKTTTLQFLAESTNQRGLYLAFNRSIANEAQARFPARVRCATAHSIAFRQVRSQLDYPEWKLTGSLTPNVIAEAFRLPQNVSFACGIDLERLAYAAILRGALNQFLRGSEGIPKRTMIPRHGLELLAKREFDSFAAQAIEHVVVLWDAMQHKTAGPPLGHDGYLKLWALGKPKAETDYIMVDEAQDLNPVLLGVLGSLQAPLVYVGDQYQQIYEWRGAINAMEKLPSKHRVLLAQSFRFGPEIAAAATIVLRALKASKALLGSSVIASHIARVKPDAILARSNAGVIANVLNCLRHNVRCSVLGGTQELERLLTDVQRIKQNLPAQMPELLGFDAWKDVMTASTQPEGEHLRGLVNLVQEHGEGRMLDALARCERSETTARVICSTAHKAKGREWNYVHLDPDFDAGLRNATKCMDRSSYEAEARLLYVAITRARLAIHLPREVAKRFSIRRTFDDVLGAG